MTSDFALEMQRVIALAKAQHRRSPILGTPHLFIALTKLDGATAAALGRGKAPPGAEPQLTGRAAANLRQASALAKKEGASQVEERYLLATILDDDESQITTIEIVV